MADSGVGAMLGAIVGDIVGSPFEFTGHKSKSFDLFSPASSFTDDTVCLIGVADALLRDVPIAARLRGWCRQYPHPVGGYGARFREWVFSDTMGAYNSKGNGAAMRVAPVAHLAKDASQAVSLAWHVTAITHDHPDAMNGAAATAFAIWMARSGANPHEIRGKIESDYGFDLSRSVDQIRATYQYSELCLETVPEALVCALTATDFEDALRNAVSLGGDADTLAAIAGGIAEPIFGIPKGIQEEALSRLDSDILAVLRRLNAAITPIEADAPNGI
jgi:ADP-ribosyl-[dinitrogen reductase] hydrolase